MKLGSLFSGVGLLDLGLERAGMTTIWQCEYDKHASKLLAEKWNVPNYGDITKVDWSQVERPDVLAGGFPCQPFSNAGLRKGGDDERYLWPEYFRAICELRPGVVIVENVAALLGSPEWGTVLGNLAEAGYDAKWACIRASDVGAPHRRERIFLVARNTRLDARCAEQRQQYETESSGTREPSEGSLAYASSESARRDTRAALSTQARRQDATSEPDSHGFGDGSFSTADPEGIQDRQPHEHQRESEPEYLDAAWRSDTGATDYAKSSPWSLSHRDGEVASNTESQGRCWPAGSRERGISGSRDSETQWGNYEPAIRRWERITRAAPRPTDDKGRLSVRFVEWMMGAPEGYTDSMSRTQALKGLGNGVVVQVAQEVGRWALK